MSFLCTFRLCFTGFGFQPFCRNQTTTSTDIYLTVFVCDNLLMYTVNIRRLFTPEPTFNLHFLEKQVCHILIQFLLSELNNVE
jgi:hypothetical protein